MEAYRPVINTLPFIKLWHFSSIFKVKRYRLCFFESTFSGSLVMCLLPCELSDQIDQQVSKLCRNLCNEPIQICRFVAIWLLYREWKDGLNLPFQSITLSFLLVFSYLSLGISWYCEMIISLACYHEWTRKNVCYLQRSEPNQHLSELKIVTIRCRNLKSNRFLAFTHLFAFGGWLIRKFVFFHSRNQWQQLRLAIAQMLKELSSCRDQVPVIR